MRTELVKKFLRENGLEKAYVEMGETSTATVGLAAEALGIEPGRVAKTLALRLQDAVILLVTRGDARIDNKKFREAFKTKVKFLTDDEVEDLTGHPAGGVCPFAPKEGCRVYLDRSLRAFDPVYPAAGARNNAVRISVDELRRLTGGQWTDVCREPE